MRPRRSIHCLSAIGGGSGVSQKSTGTRCHLVPLEAAQFELIGRTEKERESFALDSTTAEAALAKALQAAKNRGLTWHPGKIDLQPKSDLLKLVAYSERAMAASGGEE